MQNCTSGRTWLHKLQKIQHISESPSLSEMFFPPTFQLPILVTSTQNMLSDNRLILSSILVLTLASTFLLCTLVQLTLFMNRIFLHVYIFSLNTFHRQLDSLPACCQFFAPLSHLFLFIKPTSPPLSRVKISQDFWKLFRKGSSTLSHAQVPPNLPNRRFTMFLTPRNDLQGGDQQGNVWDNAPCHIWHSLTAGSHTFLDRLAPWKEVFQAG